LVSSTDLIDGYLARRLNIHSEAGAFFDSIVDFTLILGMFPLFIDAELYPLWIAGVIIFAFTVHFLESFIKKTRSSRKILRQRPLQCGSINDNFPNPSPMQYSCYLFCNIFRSFNNKQNSSFSRFSITKRSLNCGFFDYTCNGFFDISVQMLFIVKNSSLFYPIFKDSKANGKRSGGNNLTDT
jgi:hypothetical protein